MMNLGLDGKTALITGASKGIGEAIAEALAAEGCHLVLMARQISALEIVASRLSIQYGVTVDIIPIDLSSAPPLESLFTYHCPIDILINNAGAIPAGRLSGLTSEETTKAIELKMLSYMSLSRYFLKKWRSGTPESFST